MKGIFYQNKKESLLEVLIFIAAFSIPISFAFNSISFAALFLFSFTFFDYKSFLKNINSKEIYMYYYLYFSIQIFSLFYTANTSLAIETIKQNIVFVVLPVTFINLKNHIDDRKLRVTYWGMCSSLLITLLVSLSNILYKSAFSEIALSDFFRENFISQGLYNNIHVPYLSLLIVFILISTFSLPFIKKNKLNLIIKNTIIIVLLTSLLFLSGMMSLVILAIFLVVKFFRSKISNQLKVTVSIITVLSLSFGVNYITHYKKIERVRGGEHIIYRIQKLVTSKDSVRFANWESVTKVITNHPILGVGADGGLELLQKERTVLSEPYINKHNAHNDFLEIFLRYGIIGLVIYLILIYKLFKSAWLKKSYMFKWFLVVFVISGITESYLQRQIGLTFFTFFSMLLYTYKPVQD
jgi:O-antigen ligase